MGAIYKVRHLLLDEVRVIKVMRPHLRQDPSLRERFLAEGRAVARLNHANIARIIDCTIDEEGVAYLVMEFIPGWTLGDLLRRGELLPVPLCLEIAKQSLAAIGHMHLHKMVHRDIAPDNLILGSTVDGRARVKLIDLGIAKATEGGSQLTDAGVFVGKFRYAAPELFDEVSVRNEPRSDLYSLALVLYELMTLQFPIAGTTSSSLIAGHLFRPPLSFDISDPSGRLPDRLRDALMRGLAKTPDERFADAAEFAAAVAAAEPDLAPETEAVAEVLRWTSTPRPQDTTALYRVGGTQASFNAQFAPIPTPAPHPILQPPEGGPTERIPSISEQLGPSHPLARLPRLDPDASTVILLPDPEPEAQETSLAATPVSSENGLAERTTALLQEARLRAAREDVTAARQLLDHLLELDAEHSEALRLKRSLDTLQEVQIEETRRTQIIAARQASPPPSAEPPSAEPPSDEPSDESPSLNELPTVVTVAVTPPPAAPPPPPLPVTEAAEAPSSLEEEIGRIRQLQREGRIGSALEALQRSIQEHGNDPQLNSLRSELGLALLVQDAEQQQAIDPFSTVPSVSSSQLTGTPPPAPAPAADNELPSVPQADLPSPDDALHQGELLHGHLGSEAPIHPQTPVAELTLGGRGASDDATLRPAFDETSVSLNPVRNTRGATLPSGQNQRSMLIGGVILVLLFAVLGLFLSRYRPGKEPEILAVEDVVSAQLTPGFLRLDLRPWGEIESMLDQNQEQPPLNPSRFSPALLTLPPGTYQLLLRYPPDDISRQVTLEIKSGEITEHREVFRTIDSEAYFRAQNP